MRNWLTAAQIVGLLWAVLGCGGVQATHIVGGELNYRCLGGDQYRITVRVFRDCFNGVPWFDQPASIGIFGSDNSLLQHVRVWTRNNDTLPLILNDPCLVVPPNVCVHTATYDTVVTLPFRPGGYQLAYQRCCRNNTINNIVMPQSTGATYYAHITEAALLQCNSNPVFNNWPPPLICNNIPINFDHSATDAEGDSLVYLLSDPFTGATPANPMPQPPFAPPYSFVTWLPPYGVGNMMTDLTMSSFPLQIHPVTGLLRGMPNVIGQFVVGVEVREYRNGVFLSATRRDFQFNVGVCGQSTSAAFYLPAVLCTNDLVVQFNNQSTGGTGRYLWDFGVPGINSDTSSQAQPVYTYPNEGDYMITLIAEPGSVCSDTFSQTVQLRYRSLDAGFEGVSVSCTDQLLMQFNDLSTHTANPIVSWSWNFGNGQTSSAQSPVVLFTSAGGYVVQLVVQGANGCTDTAISQLVVKFPIVNVPDVLVGCDGAPVELYPEGDPDYEYLWSPAVGLSSATVANPLAAPTTTTLYQVAVSIVNAFGPCTVTDSVLVAVPDPVTLMASGDTVLCLGDAPVVVPLWASTSGGTLEWSESSSFSSVLGTGNLLYVAPTATTTYYVRTTDTLGCYTTDSVRVLVSSVQLSGDTLALVCYSAPVVLTVEATGTPPISYQWQPDMEVLGSSAGSSITLVPREVEQYRVVATDAFGCSDTLLVSLQISDIAPGLQVVAVPDTIYAGQSSQLDAQVSTPVMYWWSPAASLNSNSIRSPVATPSASTTYTVQVTDAYGCTATDTVRVVLKSYVCGPPYIFVPSGFTPNADGHNDVLFVRGGMLTDLYFAIYTRWGEKVFETTDQQRGWDGTFRGQALPPDVFGYVLRARCLDGQEYTQQGNVTLLR